MSLPNYNPSNASTLSGVLSEVLKNFGLTIENCIPAVVVSYDRTNNVAEVRPAINTILTDGTAKARDTIKLPVHLLGGAGIVISAPLSAGNTGWIIAGDRDITLFKQSLSVSNPNTYRTHKFSFGFFIPDKIKGITVQTGDENALTIQTLDGTTRISLLSGSVKVVSSNNVEVDCTNLTISATNVNITGNVSLDGDLSASGTITGQTDVVSGTISGKSHKHGGVVSGGSSTGVPQ